MSSSSHSPQVGPKQIVLKASRRAVALRYSEEEDGAPRVVARGLGDVADRILESARENNVPVREDGDLLELLALCDLGEEIPMELYSSVAELLSYLWSLNEELRPAADGNETAAGGNGTASDGNGTGPAGKG